MSQFFIENEFGNLLDQIMESEWQKRINAVLRDRHGSGENPKYWADMNDFHIQMLDEMKKVLIDAKTNKSTKSSSDGAADGGSLVELAPSETQT